VDDPRAGAVVASLTRTFGQPPVQLRTLGGSVPIAPFIEALGCPAILMPIVNFDNNQHEENENLRLGALFDGIVSIAAVLRQ
jgi:acetylornithine deacetylase/succinyl-diaminopimelate desuccinylase-like protein